MNKLEKLFPIILLSSLLITGCGKSDNQSATESATGGVQQDETVASAPAGKSEETANQADTVAPTIKAYCDAMTRKSDGALRAVYSSSSLKELDAKIKSGGYKGLADYFEAEQVSNRLCEVRNEVITGDIAIAELKTEGAPNGFKVKLIREGGAWKLTTESPELDAVTKSALK